jgi:hypothetical protein
MFLVVLILLGICVGDDNTGNVSLPLLIDGKKFNETIKEGNFLFVSFFCLLFFFVVVKNCLFCIILFYIF